MESRPIGARGLKRRAARLQRRQGLVAPHRGAWVETTAASIRLKVATSRPSRGAWVETGRTRAATGFCSGRAPRGARGLKQNREGKRQGVRAVAPLAGRVG